MAKKKTATKKKTKKKAKRPAKRPAHQTQEAPARCRYGQPPSRLRCAVGAGLTVRARQMNALVHLR